MNIGYVMGLIAGRTGEHHYQLYLNLLQWHFINTDSQSVFKMVHLLVQILTFFCSFNLKCTVYQRFIIEAQILLCA